MQTKVRLRNLRIAPRKLRLVADLIRGKSVEEAQAILGFVTKKGTGPLLKLLKSAIANAKNNFQLQEANLFISKILVDEGPKYKRWRARARGSANEIQKKTSHITLVLDELIKKTGKIAAKVGKTKEVKEAEVSGEKIFKTEKSQKEGVFPARQAKPKPKIEIVKPKTEKGLRKIFRRKAF